MNSNHRQPPTTEDVLKRVKAAERNGDLLRKLTQNGPAYQTSLTHPEFLEAVYSDGSVILGKFVHGKFVEIKDLA